MHPKYLLILLLLVGYSCSCYSQDNTSFADRIANFPTKFLDRINKKATGLEDKVIAQSQKALRRLQKQEAKLQKKLAGKDSLAAARLFANSEQKYNELENSMTQKASSVNRLQEYLPHLDTLQTSLNFLSQKGSSVLGSSGELHKVEGALSGVKDLENKLQDAETIKKYIRDRKQQLQEQFDKLGMGSALKKYKEQAYYYSAQIKEYKSILEDPDKLEQKALGLLQKLPLFQNFLKEHSELAALFPMPAGYGTPQALQGLQTRAGVQQMIQNQLASAGPNAQAMIQQNIQQAQSQLNQLKDKINKIGGMSSNEEVPDFKPNNQKTKSFWKRLEYGTNVQTVKANSFWPSTSDLGLSVGYKLNDKSVIGVGASYKMGWGKDIRHVSLTNEGIGLRSYLDWKLKGSFYFSGGYEQNYQPLTVTGIPTPATLNPGEAAWQESGLVGLSKIVSLKSKLFKKTKVQLLWDFLSYQQVPVTQPIKFRVGYNF